MVQKKNSDSGILFYGDFNGTSYELRHDGLHVTVGDIDKRTTNAIKARIMRIYSDDKNEEHKNFNAGLSYIELLRILNP